MQTQFLQIYPNGGRLGHGYGVRIKRVLVILSCCLGVVVSAEFVQVGAGGYRTDLPPGKDGKPRRQVKESPLVVPDLKAPTPTSDWWSSLIWPMHSPYSQAMFPHPLAVQAKAEGLGNPDQAGPENARRRILHGNRSTSWTDGLLPGQPR